MAKLAALNAVRLPAASSLRRLPNRKNAVSSNELALFDDRTLFYDVFIDAEASRLRAIGPPALNLRKALARMTLRINGARVRYRLRELPEQKLSLLEARITPLAINDISFELGDFVSRHRLPPLTLPKGRKVLAAISKNNRLEWISSWVDFYRHNYGIDDVILYDNGSDNIEALETALRGRATVIRWNFPYGPPGRRHNKFAQPGALNHCLRKFAGHGRLFNFDIDELLIADPDQLETELEGRDTLYFESYNVPFVRPGRSPYTHFDFTRRYAERRRSARKFVCQSEGVDVISQHNTWRPLLLPGKRPLRRNRPQRMTSEHAYFLHFLGITTNWQPHLNKLEEVGLDGLVLDDSHLRRRPKSTATGDAFTPNADPVPESAAD